MPASQDADVLPPPLQVQAPHAPQPPVLPVLTPCPPGWMALDVRGTGACAPWPQDQPEYCAAGEAHFPGEPGCRPIGRPCPAGDYAGDLPADRAILFVKPGSTGGDGTRAHPFATIGAATTAAAAGTMIALARGNYDERVRMPAGVALHGACAAETIVATSTPTDVVATIEIGGRDVELSNLQIGGRAIGVHAGRGTAVQLSGVLVAGAEIIGLFLDDGGELSGEDVVVRDTRSQTGNGRFGRGLDVAGGTVQLTRAVFERNRDTAIRVTRAGSSGRFESVAVRDTMSAEATRALGAGIRVAGGAFVAVEQLIADGNRTSGAVVTDPGSELSLTDAVVKRTDSQASDGLAGGGVYALLGARLTVRRARIEANRSEGVGIADASTTATIADTIILSTAGERSDGRLGAGLRATVGGEVTMMRALIAGNLGSGVALLADGTSGHLSDVTVEDTDFGRERFGAGISLSASRAELRRVRIERSRVFGVLAGSGAQLMLDDVTVRETRVDAMGSASAIFAAGGSQVALLRASLEENEASGVLVAEAGTAITGADLAVRDTAASPVSRLFGIGLQVSLGARVSLVRACFERNRDVAVFVRDEGSTLELSDALVADTQPRACIFDTCPDFAAGEGVAVARGGSIRMTQFVISGSALAGVQVLSGGSMDLQDGEVRENPVGANVQVPSFDLQRLRARVIYRDNERNLDVHLLPEPELLVPPLP